MLRKQSKKQEMQTNVVQSNGYLSASTQYYPTWSAEDPKSKTEKKLSNKKLNKYS